MTSRIAALLDGLPGWVPATAAVLATLLAAGGTGLLTLAAVYGDPVPAWWGGAGFAAAGVLWHVADHG